MTCINNCMRRDSAALVMVITGLPPRTISTIRGFRDSAATTSTSATSNPEFQSARRGLFEGIREADAGAAGLYSYVQNPQPGGLGAPSPQWGVAGRRPAEGVAELTTCPATWYSPPCGGKSSGKASGQWSEGETSPFPQKSHKKSA